MRVSRRSLSIEWHLATEAASVSGRCSVVAMHTPLKFMLLSIMAFSAAVTPAVKATAVSRRHWIAGCASGLMLHPRRSVAAQSLTFITTPTGLRWADISIGAGEAVSTNSRVTFDAKGRLVGKQGWIYLDTVLDDEPYRLTMGKNEMIDGLEEGLLGMKAGGKRRLIIPSSMGYRDKTRAPIPRSFGQQQRLFGTVLNENRRQQEASGLGDGNDVAGIVALDVALISVRPPL